MLLVLRLNPIQFEGLADQLGARVDTKKILLHPISSDKAKQFAACLAEVIYQLLLKCFRSPSNDIGDSLEHGVSSDHSIVQEKLQGQQCRLLYLAKDSFEDFGDALLGLPVGVVKSVNDIAPFKGLAKALYLNFCFTLGLVYHQ